MLAFFDGLVEDDDQKASPVIRLLTVAMAFNF